MQFHHGSGGEHGCSEQRAGEGMDAARERCPCQQGQGDERASAENAHALACLYGTCAGQTEAAPLPAKAEAAALTRRVASSFSAAPRRTIWSFNA
jgi:hypothetical protein